jgi:hypothetical protein
LFDQFDNQFAVFLAEGGEQLGNMAGLITR